MQTLADTSCTDCFIHSRAAYYPNSEEHGTDGMKWSWCDNIEKENYKCYIYDMFLLNSLQLVHAALVPLVLRWMAGMYQLHLLSTEMVLVVEPVTRWVTYYWK